MRNLLKFIAAFDYITPMATVTQNIASGPSHTFLIPEGQGISGGDCARMLRNKGIKTWGHMVVNGHYMLTVKQAQANFASHLLERAGVALGAGPVTQSRKRPGQAK